MDFASLMSKEISKTKSESTHPDQPAKKYQKRSDVEADRKAAYIAEQRAQEEAKEAKAKAKRKREEEEALASKEREEKRRRLAEDSKTRREEEEREEERKRRKRLGLPELVEQEEVEEQDDNDLSDEVLTTKLRELGEPILLFGESHKARLRRWKKVGIVMSNGPIPTSLELLEEKNMKVPDKVPEDDEGKKYLYRQLASYFTMVLREWEEALGKEEKRDTFASKAAIGAMVQSKENMTPLFRKFEKGDLDDSLLAPVVEIVKAAQERRYVDANDGYLRLSIGKAAWPIGVTMVGIHERSAREKLHESEKGHVMGDEVTRKFLQGIKGVLVLRRLDGHRKT